MPATLGSENDHRTKPVAIWVTKSLARLGILKRRFTVSVKPGSAPVTRLTTTTSHPHCELAMPPTTFCRAGGNDDGWLAQKLGAHHLPCPDSMDGNYDHLACDTHQVMQAFPITSHRLRPAWLQAQTSFTHAHTCPTRRFLHVRVPAVREQNSEPLDLFHFRNFEE
jgi:hypothetical protein